MSAGFTPSPWEATYFTRPDGSPIETVEHVAETLAHSAHQCESVTLHGVTIDAGRDNLVICYTGNGPTSEANANLIAVAPDLFVLAEKAMRWFADNQCAGDLAWEIGAALSKARGSSPISSATTDLEGGADRALVSDQAASRLAPPGFDHGGSK